MKRGPGHYPCSPLVSGANELLMPHVGWANVMPAADATVSLKFDGRQLNFEGNGYHDKVLFFSSCLAFNLPQQIRGYNAQSRLSVVLSECQK